jgi:hypothetical protein
MPRFWLKRRRSDGPAREWDGSRSSDPDQARRQPEQARLITERAIHLHRKAEAVIRACREDDAKTGVLGAEGGEVRERYRRLREELRLLDLPASLADKLTSILDHHLRLVSLALDLSYRPQTKRIRAQRHRLHGLGPSAGDLLALRDRLPQEPGERWWPASIGKKSPMATVSDDEVLLLWRALSGFRSGANPGCRPEGGPPRS